MADQARLEGSRGSAISASAVEAAGILIRIAYRFEMIARARFAASQSDLPQGLREHCTLLEQEYCDSLESGLAKLRPVTPPGLRAAGASTRGDIGTASTNTEQSGAPAVPETDWLTSVPRDYELRLEPYRRMPILLSQLDSVFSRIAAS
jgi:hypothetical protein